MRTATRSVLAILLTAAVACGPPPKPVLAPIAPAQGALLTGINAAFEAPEDADFVEHLCGWGNQIVRSTINDASEVDPIVHGFEACPATKVLVLLPNVYGPAIDNALTAAVAAKIVALPNVIGVELGNETDLAAVPAAAFGRFVADGYGILRDAKFTGLILSGGISNVRPEKLEYLRQAMAAGQWPADLVVAVHRYPEDGEPTAPQKGHSSRSTETQAVAAAAAGHRVALTELGYQYCDTRLEADVANYIAYDFAAAQTAGWLMAILYQKTDGADPAGACQGINHYGVRDLAMRYRPSADVLSAWGRR